MPVIVTDVCGTRVNVHPYLTTCEAVVNFIRFGTRRVRQKERNFLTSWVNVIFSRGTLTRLVS